MATFLRIAASILILAFLLGAVFVALESATGEPPAGVGEVAVDFAEALVLAAAMFGSAFVALRLRRVEAQTEALGADVRDAAAAGVEWRRQSQLLLRGLGEAVDAQFRAWGLTAAEAEVAGLIVKGLSCKEVARARHTSEATIRQQAQSVYRKSGLGNRAELAAYFLEDVFDAGASRVGPAAARVTL